MKLVGFLNLGNTCYLNSVLQCFIYNNNFQNAIKNTDTDLSKELLKITKEVDLVKDGNYTFCKYNLTFFINYFSKWFKRFEQHDSHEFITCFLDKLNLPHELYHGKTKMSTKCSCCGNTTDVFEDFNTINLNTQGGDSLTDIFVDYLKSEIHDDPDNLYHCEKCEKLTVSEKKISLEQLPKTLIIVLKRYTSRCNIEINDTLYIKNNENVIEYTLKSVINHFGNVYSGHYNNFVCIDKEWIFIDDDSFSLANLNFKNAYILFYEN